MASNENLILFLFSEIIFFSCSHIVSHYVNRIENAPIGKCNRLSPRRPTRRNGEEDDSILLGSVR